MVCGGLMIFGGAVCLGCMALEAAADSADDKTALLEAQRWMAFVGKFAISGSFCAVYVFAAEVFPTVLRSTGRLKIEKVILNLILGIGFGSMFGRIGGFLSPFIIQIPATWIIYLVSCIFLIFIECFFQIFGAFGIVSGALVFFLPETNGKPTLQTLEEALEFYKNPTASKTYQVSPTNSQRNPKDEKISKDEDEADF